MDREDSARIAIALERIAKSLEKIANTAEEAFPEYEAARDAAVAEIQRRMDRRMAVL